MGQQTNYQTKLFYRTPVAAFFTIIFPLLLMVIFGALFGSQEIEALGITVAQYYVPALAVFAAASATYTNIAVGTAFQRDEGILKRFRGSPLAPSIFFGGKVISATVIAVVAVVLMFGAGVPLYGVTIYVDLLAAATLTFLVGVGCFAALGLLVAALAPTGNAATAIANATLLPLAFFSGLFVPTSDDTPQWIVTVGDIFPLKHFNEAFQAAFLPETEAPGFDWFALGYMALWGIVALFLGLRLFKWESKRG